MGGGMGGRRRLLCGLCGRFGPPLDLSPTMQEACQFKNAPEMRGAGDHENRPRPHKAPKRKAAIKNCADFGGMSPKSNPPGRAAGGFYQQATSAPYEATEVGFAVPDSRTGHTWSRRNPHRREANVRRQKHYPPFGLGPENIRPQGAAALCHPMRGLQLIMPVRIAFATACVRLTVSSLRVARLR